jgi:hypothetical protein
MCLKISGLNIQYFIFIFKQNIFFYIVNDLSIVFCIHLFIY